MSQNPLFDPLLDLLIFIFLILAGQPPSAVAVDPYFRDCSVNTTCGRHPINYPFYTDNDACGSPGFNISCINQTPFLAVSGTLFIVHEIVYANESIRVSNAAVSGPERPCFPQIRNFSIEENDRFNLAPNQRQLFMLSNCNMTSAPELLSQYRIGCPGEDARNSSLALFGDDQALGDVAGMCGSAVDAPVAGEDAGGGGGYWGLLGRGFVLEWIASDCSVCAATGGRCGFNHSSRHFRCFCPDGPHAQQCRDHPVLEAKKRALIYEFMPNGSLDKFVYHERRSALDERNFILGWENLYRIAVGIARGLEYLHNGCNTRIVHFDIKPHNILLDDDLCPKISDFGLAKLCTRKDSIVSLLDARGTIGFIALEVFSRNFGNISHKSDVYSYGMMVLEMAGMRKNIDVGVSHTSEVYFPTWIYQQLELDGDLKLQGMTTSEDLKVARKMMIVGLWCIQTNPSDRPSISKVIEMLEGGVDALRIPPKPYLSSPSRARPDFTSSSISEL